jgi:flagellar biosynthesis anti-sigma factor FlgM
MTNSINPLSPYLQADLTAAQASGSASVAGSASLPATAAGSTEGSEAVTVSPDAATTTQLLEAARNADGVDSGAVQQLRGAVQSGSYDVTPEALAQSIIGALKAGAP